LIFSPPLDWPRFSFSVPRQSAAHVSFSLAKRCEARIEEGHLMSHHVHTLISIPPKYSDAKAFLEGLIGRNPRQGRVYKPQRNQFLYGAACRRKWSNRRHIIVPRFVPGWWTLTDVIRTDFRKDVDILYGMILPEMKEWLKSEVEEIFQRMKQVA